MYSSFDALVTDSHIADTSAQFADIDMSEQSNRIDTPFENEMEKWYQYRPNSSYADKFISSENSIDIKLAIEQKFYCVVSEIDKENNNLLARVYDPSTKYQVMEVEVSFDLFESDDQPLLEKDTVFYWSIGRKIVTRTLQSDRKHFSKASAKTTKIEPFSELLVKRVYSPNNYSKNGSNVIGSELSKLFK